MSEQGRITRPHEDHQQPSIPREPVRPYDALTDPLLAPNEVIDARVNDLASLPVGACYWLLKGRRFKARRISVGAPPMRIS